MAKAYRLTIDHGVADQLALDTAVTDVTETTRLVFNRANILTPVDTGRLRAGNQSHVDVSGHLVTGHVFNNTVYAEAVHDGSAAHTVRPQPQTITIRPKHGKYLRFTINGRVIYARQVRTQKPLRFVVRGKVVYARSARIPARRGRPWLVRALTEVAVPRGYAIGPG